MADKLNGDGVWATRMMLPEHKEAIRAMNRQQVKKDRPMLDPQELELIERALSGSLQEQHMVTLQLFKEYGEEQLRGIVIDVQSYRQEIKLQIEEGETEWVRIRDILSVSE